MNLSDWIGFIGVFILLIAFFCNLFNFLHKNSVLYMLLNTVGAGIACVAAILINYLPFIVLEGSWAVVSLVGLIQSLNAKKTN